MSGKIAVVTGAGSGIGRASALALLNNGYKVALAGRRKDALDETARMAGNNAPNALVVPTDVTRRDDIVALCAEATGCMDAINAATLEYIKTRKQFGQPIGKFQVLQHRMVDCFTNAQEARSMTLMASLKIDDKDPVVRRKAASGAKVQIGKSGKFCGQSAVQMHGGAGVTKGVKVEELYREIRALRIYEGASEVQRQIIARELLKEVRQ